MKNILNWIRRERDKQMGYLSFRVLYPTGRKTTRLPFCEARSLKEMFGGEVIYDPFEHTWQ